MLNQFFMNKAFLMNKFVLNFSTYYDIVDCSIRVFCNGYAN